MSNRRIKRESPPSDSFIEPAKKRGRPLSTRSRGNASSSNQQQQEIDDDEVMIIETTKTRKCNERKRRNEQEMNSTNNEPKIPKMEPECSESNRQIDHENGAVKMEESMVNIVERGLTPDDYQRIRSGSVQIVSLQRLLRPKPHVAVLNEDSAQENFKKFRKANQGNALSNDLPNMIGKSDMLDFRQFDNNDTPIDSIEY